MLDMAMDTMVDLVAFLMGVLAHMSPYTAHDILERVAHSATPDPKDVEFLKCVACGHG